MISAPMQKWLGTRKGRDPGPADRSEDVESRELHKGGHTSSERSGGRPKLNEAAGPSGSLDPGYTKCGECQRLVFRKDLEDSLEVCPDCGHHHPIGAADRIRSLMDPGTFEEFDAALYSEDVLGFDGYKVKLEQAFAKTNQGSAIKSGVGEIGGREVAIAVIDFEFVGGSMGSVVGEKTARTIETAYDRAIPFLSVCASGGARMFEGVYSLMQMAKTTIALSRFLKSANPYISVLADPTFGGVTASFATAADVILAEPGARIGFAGARVIKQTTKETLPDGFQTAEFQRERGMVDRIVHRHAMRAELRDLLELLS